MAKIIVKTLRVTDVKQHTTMFTFNDFDNDK